MVTTVKSKSRRISLLLVAAMLLATALFSPAQAAPAPGPIRVTIDGAAVTLDQAPQMVGGRVMVPYRVIAQRLGARVSWDASTRSVTVTKGADVMRLTVGQTTAVRGGRNVTLEAAPMLVGGSVFVPLRFLGEGLDTRVHWDGAARTVSLRSTPPATGQVPAPAPLPQGAPIRVGIVGPMAFLPGEHMWHGATFGAEEINKAGGIVVGNVRRPIQLVRVDSNEIVSVPDAASAVERAITRDRVDFLIGGLRTEAVQAMQDVISEHRRIFIGVGASHPVLTQRVAQDYENYKYFFRVAPFSAVHLGTVVFRQLGDVAAVVRRDLGVARPRVAVIGERAVWVDHIAAAAERQIPAMGMELAGVWRTTAVAADVTAELSAIREARAQIIITLFTGPVGTVFAKQWAELQVPAAVAGINVDAQGGRFWRATGERANFIATMSTMGRIPISPRTIPFYDNFMRRHNNEVPLYTASGAYDSLYILKEAIERAGTVSTNAVIESLKKTDYASTAGQVVFNREHDVTFGPGYVMGVGVQWQDGRPQVFWPAGGGTVNYTLPPWVIRHWRR